MTDIPFKLFIMTNRDLLSEFIDCTSNLVVYPSPIECDKSRHWSGSWSSGYVIVFVYCTSNWRPGAKDNFCPVGVYKRRQALCVLWKLCFEQGLSSMLCKRQNESRGVIMTARQSLKGKVTCCKRNGEFRFRTALEHRTMIITM